MSVSPPSDSLLQQLLSLFYADSHLLAHFERLETDQLPDVYRQLLAHDHHMTVTVEQFHGGRVDVEVLEDIDRDGRYLRKILLRRQEDQRVVQFGIVRLDFTVLDHEVETQIRSRKIPLGRVLIEHDVLRTVKLGEVYEVICGAELAKWFDVASGTKTFGRTAVIHCNGAPAVELIEIVAPVSAPVD